MMAMRSPRARPRRDRPVAEARTSASICVQVQVCQIPKSLCRIAGRLGKRAALRTRNFANVSGPASGTLSFVARAESVRSREVARAAVRRIRERAEQRKLGRFDLSEWKSYRDEGRA